MDRVEVLSSYVVFNKAKALQPLCIVRDISITSYYLVSNCWKGRLRTTEDSGGRIKGAYNSIARLPGIIMI